MKKLFVFVFHFYPHKMETKQYLMINYRTNIFCCADDVVLLAPSSEGLQIMIDIVNLML